MPQPKAGQPIRFMFLFLCLYLRILCMFEEHVVNCFLGWDEGMPIRHSVADHQAAVKPANEHIKRFLFFFLVVFIHIISFRPYHSSFFLPPSMTSSPIAS
jgi:hypothetical protein